MLKGDISNWLVLGIDTGKNGGICAISGQNMVATKCPKTISEMSDLIRSYSELDKSIQIMCIIEKNHSMPMQGVRSVWTFGYNSGAWEGILSSFNIPFILVPPKKWMKHYTIKPKMKKMDRKRYLKELAIRLYPNHKRMITLATSDAILMAQYGLDKYIK